MAKNLKTFLGQYSSVVVNTDIKENEKCDIFWSIQSARGTQGITQSLCETNNQTRFGGVNSPGVFKWNWIVPAGVNTATFHIWGGGGSGAPSHCCMSGVPGGSGAYAFKTVSVTPGECYTACYEGAERYCCTDLSSQAVGSQTTDNACPWIMYGLRGMKAYVNGTGLTNFCVEGGNPGVVRCGWSWGQDPQNDPVNPFPGSECCQMWKICHIVRRRTIDSDNDRYAVGKYYGADGGARGIYGCHSMACCNSRDTDANRCADREVVPFPGGLTPNTWAPFGDMELASINGGVVHLQQCNIISPVHGGYQQENLSNILGYMCSSRSGAKIGVGGLSQTTCGGTCCCGAPGGIPFLRIEYS